MDDDTSFEESHTFIFNRHLLKLFVISIKITHVNLFGNFHLVHRLKMKFNFQVFIVLDLLSILCNAF